MRIHELYENVTNSIIAELEAGAPPWTKPWKNGVGVSGLLPANAATGRHYHGVNVPILWHSASQRAFPTHQWMTFKQAQERNAQVRKGERGTHVVFTKKLRVTDEETEEQKTIGFLRGYVVFNVAQIEGLQVAPASLPVPEAVRHEKAEAFIAATKAIIHYGHDMAAYVPSIDIITMPAREAFKTIESFYATGLHECGHWSGAKKRLDRDLSGRFGTRSYAAEELVAELTSAFLCAHLGIAGELRHSGYVANWIELLKEDARAIFTASAKAQQAADYLRSFSEKIEEEPLDAAA